MWFREFQFVHALYPFIRLILYTCILCWDVSRNNIMVLLYRNDISSLYALCVYWVSYFYTTNSYILASGGCRFIIGIRSSDVVYSPFPLHHSVAGMIAMAGCFAGGFKFVLRKKFSASHYWKDCSKYKVTVSDAAILGFLVPFYCMPYSHWF